MSFADHQAHKAVTAIESYEVEQMTEVIVWAVSRSKRQELLFWCCDCTIAHREDIRHCPYFQSYDFSLSAGPMSLITRFTNCKINTLMNDEIIFCGMHDACTFMRTQW